MPSGPPQLHKFWGRYYETTTELGMADQNAMRYLNENGYTLTKEWEWSHPTIKHYNDMSELEYSALTYLCLEWDFGGLITGN
jgi:hypothetical protein